MTGMKEFGALVRSAREQRGWTQTELARRRAAIMDVADALPIVAANAPQRLPELLHALDVQLVLGGDGASLRWGESSRPFVS